MEYNLMVLEYSVHIINNKRQCILFLLKKKEQNKIERNYMERGFIQMKCIRYTQTSSEGYNGLSNHFLTYIMLLTITMIL